VLFDAIERSVKSTLNDLYQGVLEDYVRCLACGTESKREDMYLDLSLAVRNQFDCTFNDSLEKDLSSFVKAERLSGDNQYNCDSCKCKQDAIKGLRFKSFPKVFVMQLKRFDLDMKTLAKKKINDLVSFPFVLNLNPYIGEHINSEAEETEKSAETQVSLLPADYESRSISLKRYERKEALNEDRDKPSLEPDPLSREFTA
jgi:ubiquitin carboxyl-terminal hydrolase 47